MGFGDATSRSDVELGVNLGRFRADMREAGTVYDQTTGRMSKDSLRAAISHEKLLRAISRSGPESLAAKSATLAYRREMEALDQTSNRTTGALAREERALGRIARGSLSGAGALGRLRGAAVFASTSFLGGFGLTYALRAAVNAASTLQEETEKTGVVFGKNAHDVQTWAKTLALSFGVAEEEALKSAGVFGNMFHSLHIGEQDAATMSKRLVELAADMASFNNASPEETLQALSSGLAGQVRPLRQYGVFLSQDRIKAEAYADGIAKTGKSLDATQKLQASYNIILKDTAIQQGDVARNSGSLSVAQSKANAELQQAEAIIGNNLRPELANLANDAAEYLDKANKSGQLQREVNHLFREGSQVAHGLAEGFGVIRSVAKPLVHELGGVERTAKLVIEAFAVYKLAKIATGIRGIGKAWGFVGTQATAAAGAETAAAGAAGGAATGGTLLGLGGKGPLKLIPGGTLGAAAAGAALALGQRGESSVHVGGPLDVSVGPGDTVAYRDPVTGKYLLVSGFHGKSAKALDTFLAADIQRRHPELTPPQITGEDVAQRGAAARQQHATTGKGGGGGRTGPGRKHGFGLSYARQLEAARAAAGQGSVLGAAQDELRDVKAQLAGGRLNKQGVLDALAEKAQLEDQINGILDARDAKADAKAEERRKKREAAERKATERRKAAARRRREELAKQHSARIDLLTNVPLDLRIEEQTAIAHGASEAKLLAIYKQELKAIERQIPIIRRLHLGKQAIYDARRNEAEIQKKITGLNKKTSAGTTDLLGQAAELERLYGSNIGRRNDPLSPQDALGLLGELVRLTRENTRHAATTAKSTQRIGSKGGIDQITMARALAHQGL